MYLNILLYVLCLPIYNQQVSNVDITVFEGGEVCQVHTLYHDISTSAAVPDKSSLVNARLFQALVKVEAQRPAELSLCVRHRTRPADYLLCTRLNKEALKGSTLKLLTSIEQC